MGASNEPKDISVDTHLNGNAEYVTLIQTSQKYVFDETSIVGSQIWSQSFSQLLHEVT